ncbi:hypothetical protein, partial [Streptomyces sp. NPDC058953]
MAEPRDHSGDDDAAAEHELRVLLERTVPDLPTPLNRMRQVRDRVRRRRRRRRAVVGAAATAALTAAVLAVGGSLLPRAGGGGTADEAAPEATRDPAAAPERPGPRAKKVTNPDLAGLVVAFPAGWHTVNAPDRPDKGVSSRTYAATTPLTSFDWPCRKSPCMPLRELPADGLFVDFTLERSYQHPAALLREGRRLGPEEILEPDCRTVGGTQAFSGVVGGVPEARAILSVLVCAGPAVTGARLTQVAGMMDSATFALPGGGGTKKGVVTGAPAKADPREKRESAIAPGAQWPGGATAGPGKSA